MSSAISLARRLSKETTVSPLRLAVDSRSMNGEIISSKPAPRQAVAGVLQNHARRRGVIRRFVDEDKTSGGSVAGVTVNDEGLLRFYSHSRCRSSQAPRCPRYA